MTPDRKLPEQWLNDMVTVLRPWFTHGGLIVPGKIKAHVNEPRRSHHGCKYPQTKDGVFNIFVGGDLEELTDVGSTLVHELVHVVIDPVKGHPKMFRTTCQAVGHSGATKRAMGENQMGPELTDHFMKLALHLGRYPWKPLPLPPKRTGGNQNPTYKAHCPGCKSVVRMKLKTYLRGVVVTCDNDECELRGEPMEIDEGKAE